MTRTIEVSEETYEKIKQQLGEDSCKDIKLENAAWIADSGRFMQAIKDGELKEVEP